MKRKHSAPPDTPKLEVAAAGGPTGEQKAIAALGRSEARYRSLFENMLDGYAYCQMLFEDGAPRDFIYLEINDSFARLTGLKDVVGKKASEAIPGIRESSPELFEIYGRVASTGRPERFQMYLEPLGIWFSVSVYCPGQDHFVAVFENVTERKVAESNQALVTQTLRTLNSGSGDLPFLIGRILRVIKDSTGWDAVGLRLRE
jgi:PAS domain-containing protein